MRRLNVQFSQVEECISKALFALPALPASPPIRRGEELLLQLVLRDARGLGVEDRRVEFALIFDHVENDSSGKISRKHWPNAGRTWKYILHCSETIPTIPFSLERLALKKSYAGQMTAVYIDPDGEEKIRPFLKGGTPAIDLWSVASVDQLLRAIRNYDQVERLAPVRQTKVERHSRVQSDPWLPDALKRYYNHRCQVCLHDFEPRYGTPYADTHVLSSRKAAPTVSTDVVVLCPNHNSIIGAARADFDRPTMAFTYENGLVEKLTLRDHLLAV